MYYRSHFGTVTEKDKITVNSRFRSFISRVRDNNYLLPNILQIHTFNDLYVDKLDPNRKRIVNKFLSLKEESLINRMIYKWLLN